MPNYPGSNFVVHAVRKSDGMPVDFPAESSFNAAKSIADQAVAEGVIEPEFTITWVTPGGGEGMWQQL